MVPNILPIFATYGLIGFFGFKFDYAISTIACALLGIAVDDSIHFVHKYEQLVKQQLPWHKIFGKCLGKYSNPCLQNRNESGFSKDHDVAGTQDTTAGLTCLKQSRLP